MVDFKNIPRLAIPDNIKPYLPLLVGLLPETVRVGGKVVLLRTTMLKAISDGDLDAEDLMTFLLAYAGAPNAPVTLPPTVTPVTLPAPDPNPAVPPTAPTITGLLSWVEECWSDWFKDDPLTTHPGEGSDWAEGGSPIHNEIVTGKRNLPPGGRVRFMAEVPPAGSQNHPVPIAHVFEIDGKRYTVLSTSGEEQQPFGGLAHVVRGPRFRAANGWDVTIQFRAFPAPAKTLTYWVQDENGRKSDPVTIGLAYK